jgi:hypothetical protein
MGKRHDPVVIYAQAIAEKLNAKLRHQHVSGDLDKSFGT